MRPAQLGLACTVSEILAIICQNLKRSHDRGHAHLTDVCQSRVCFWDTAIFFDFSRWRLPPSWLLKISKFYWLTLLFATGVVWLADAECVLEGGMWIGHGTKMPTCDEVTHRQCHMSTQSLSVLVFGYLALWLRWYVIKLGYLSQDRCGSTSHETLHLASEPSPLWLFYFFHLSRCTFIATCTENLMSFECVVSGQTDRQTDTLIAILCIRLGRGAEYCVCVCLSVCPQRHLGNHTFATH